MIEIEDLWKAYGDKQVLKGLSLTVRTGETVVILGRSGVGKSVLLKHVIGIAKADRGHIEIDNVRISDLRGEKLYRAGRNTGMLFQGSALFDSMDIAENTAFYLKQHGNPKTGKQYAKSEITDMVDEALKMVDLSGVQRQMPSDLSGGMRKRAALARLIVYRPEYLLFDEPTTGLDPITAMQINELIVKTQEELRTTSLVVTHDMTSARFVGDRLALHRDGRIAHIADPDEFFHIDDPTIAFLKKVVSEDPRTLRRKRG
ncbi:MAG: ATP-binding cassette domain-containing protein [Simkaniaceae bacterium]|nr:ATP-binding cassette domain-containing protein [Simkaniaceae bacterium]